MIIASGLNNDVNMNGMDFVYAQNQYDEYINGIPCISRKSSYKTDGHE